MQLEDEVQGLDIDKSSDPHSAVGGGDHCGVGHAQGHGSIVDLRIRHVSQKTHRTKDLETSQGFQQYKSQILPGPYRIRKEINSVMLKSLDPSRAVPGLARGAGSRGDHRQRLANSG